MPVRATRQIPRNKKTRDSGATIRVGYEGAHSAEATHQSLWLTLEEAEALAAELANAIRQEKALRPQHELKAA